MDKAVKKTHKEAITATLKKINLKEDSKPENQNKVKNLILKISYYTWVIVLSEVCSAVGHKGIKSRGAYAPGLNKPLIKYSI